MSDKVWVFSLSSPPLVRCRGGLCCQLPRPTHPYSHPTLSSPPLASCNGGERCHVPHPEPTPLHPRPPQSHTFLTSSCETRRRRALSGAPGAAVNAVCRLRTDPTTRSVTSTIYVAIRKGCGRGEERQSANEGDEGVFNKRLSRLRTDPSLLCNKHHLSN